MSHFLSFSEFHFLSSFFSNFIFVFFFFFFCFSVSWLLCFFVSCLHPFLVFSFLAAFVVMGTLTRFRAVAPAPTHSRFQLGN